MCLHLLRLPSLRTLKSPRSPDGRPGILSVRACSHSGKSTGWNARCVPTLTILAPWYPRGVTLDRDPPCVTGFRTQDSKRVGGGTHRVLATSGPHPVMVPALAPFRHPSAIPIPPTVAPRYS
ncbi:hypothetical protein BC826DRAFT_1037593, partial [Russula brevipes]